MISPRKIVALCAPLLVASGAAFCLCNVTERPAWAQPFPDRAPVFGVVRDSKGAPISGALVSLRRQNDTGNFAFWGGETRTDEDGLWRFDDSEIGLYYVNIEASGFAPQQNMNLDWRHASAPFEARLKQLVSLQLRLTLPDGTRAANRDWMLRMRSEAEIVDRRVQSDANGIVSARNIVPATYALSLSGNEGFATLSQFVINAQKPVFEADVALQKGANLRFKVTDTRSNPVGGARFSLTPATPNETRRLLGSSEFSVDFAASASAPGDGTPTDDEASQLFTLDGQGVAEISNLPPAIYRARLLLAGANLGGDGEQTVDLTVQNSAELVWKVDVSRAGTLVIDAQTPEDAPLANTQIALRFLWIGSISPESEGETAEFLAGAGNRRVMLDGAGRAQIYPVRPGRYRLFAQVIERNTNRERADREFGPFEATVSGAQSAGNVTLFIPAPQKLAR